MHFDTTPIIYFIEEHPQYFSIVEPVLRSLAAGAFRGTASVMTLHEVLVQPMKNGRADLARLYREFLLEGEIRVMACDARIAEKAAELRARHRFKPPDAIILATAVEAGADLLVTNDLDLRAFNEVNMEVVILDDFVPSAGSGS